MQVAPHVERLDWAIGAKPMAMYLITGDRLILVDTGLPDTPETVYLPAIAAAGRTPDDVALAVITHADADHIGGNHALREHFPHALLSCHALDKRWCSDPEVLTNERYDGFLRYGLRYDAEVFRVLRSWMGPAEPMDLLLQQGDQIRISDDEWLEVHHAPGHTAGHLLLFNPTHRYALIGDAIFGDAQRSTEGAKAAAPPYTDVVAYRGTIDLIERLAPDLLLTCHYPVMRGEEITRFIRDSRAWSIRAEEAVADLLAHREGSVTLHDAIQALNTVLGPFNDPGELQWPLLAHFAFACESGIAEETVDDEIVCWRRAI